MNYHTLSIPLDKIRRLLLQIFTNVAKDLDIPFFIIGATARDIVLYHIHEIKQYRATIDVDFAVMVKDWAQFDTMRNHLLKTDNISEKANAPAHRLYYQQSYPFDLVPFGFLKDASEQIHWPPDYALVMNIQGFEEVYKNAILVEIAPNVMVHVASLAGQAILKLFAWDARKHEKKHDAKDFGAIVHHYLDAGNNERIFTEAPEWLDEEEFDYELAGAKLLGRDIAKIIKQKTLDKLRALMTDELNQGEESPLLRYMMEDVYSLEHSETKGIFLLDALHTELKMIFPD